MLDGTRCWATFSAWVNLGAARTSFFQGTLRKRKLYQLLATPLFCFRFLSLPGWSRPLLNQRTVSALSSTTMKVVTSFISRCSWWQENKNIPGNHEQILVLHLEEPQNSRRWELHGIERWKKGPGFSGYTEGIKNYPVMWGLWQAIKSGFPLTNHFMECHFFRFRALLSLKMNIPPKKDTSLVDWWNLSGGFSVAQARILNASWHRFMRRKLETLAMQEARQKSCQKKLDETNLDFDISMCGYSLQDTVCILLYMYAYKWIYIYI